MFFICSVTTNIIIIHNYYFFLSPIVSSIKFTANKLIDDINANVPKLKWISNGKFLLFDIDHAYNKPPNTGPKILPNAANDCEIPLTLPKYFFSVELFIIKLTKTTELVANDPFKIKKKHDNIDKERLSKLLESDNSEVLNTAMGFNICIITNNL